MQEFELINQYFNWGNDTSNHTGNDVNNDINNKVNNGVILGVGDDGAICQPPKQDYQLVTSSDTSTLGVHFSQQASPADIAYKSLAVNLSDMAAMGATPKWFSLALSLPKNQTQIAGYQINHQWLLEFSSSLKNLANEFGVSLIGGDTTRAIKGVLSISIHITGFVKKNQALLRSGAQVGDAIFVSNTLGDAALAWKKIQDNQHTPNKSAISQHLLQTLNTPYPQVKLGLALVGIANSCIDISDGLLPDLGHILKASQVGAIIDVNLLPLSDELKRYIQSNKDWCLPLTGGDDYQLCFSVPAKNVQQLEALTLLFKVTKIGTIKDKEGLEVLNADIDHCRGYQHFR